MLHHSREGSGEHRVADINSIVDESLNLAYHGARAEKAGFSIALQRDLDPSVLEVLKASARENGRSLQAEIHEVLRDAARFRAAGTRKLVTTWQRRLTGRRFSDSAKLIREDRDKR